MTKKQIVAASFLRNAYMNACEQADALDPKRTNKIHEAVLIERIAHIASEAFYALTGKLPTQVEFHELNTATPAAWTKEVNP